ncbi:Caskin-2 [Trichinella pseudospiralis]|uniref:Caskin-2 n=1 Tax=Trichinella pseudospiralis TaxID=6337 RepID=A0A0V1G612_TRIPS|nr:Caskin-2 [Trichinella pseudospiralis]
MKRNSTGTNYSANTFGFSSLKAHTETMKSMSVCHLHDWQSLQSCCSSSSSFSRGNFSEKSSRPASTDLTAMIASGLPDAEVLQSWLNSFNCGCYAVLFLKAGYDVQTVSKMTPETKDGPDKEYCTIRIRAKFSKLYDNASGVFNHGIDRCSTEDNFITLDKDLTAIGISNPDHRKKIIYEVRRMNITNTWPCYRKDFPVSQWLDELGLSDYKAAFELQGCHTVDDVFVLSWEDLEDMGVEKLGHLKRLLAACKKLKDTKSGRRTMSSDEVCRYSELSNCCNLQTGRGGGGGGGGGGAVLQPSATTDIRPYFSVGGTGAAAVGVGGGCGVNGGPQLQTFQSSPRKVPTTSGVSRLSIFQRMQANNGGACSTAQQHLTGKARAIVHPVPSSVAKPIGKIYGSPRMGEDLKKRSEPDLRRGRFHNVGSVTKLSLAKCDYSGASDSCPTSPPASARSWDHGASACTGGGARRSVFRLSAHLDEIAERNGGCVVPSAPAPPFPADELLPPPTPPSLRCEASIQQLRSIRRNPPTQTNILSDCSEILSRSDCFSSPLGSTTTNSSGSCSFLVDRSICSEDEIQVDRKVNTVGQFQFRKSENDLHRHFDTTVNTDEPGGSLDHIGSMLQNLTDELDALLHEPEAVVSSFFFNQKRLNKVHF